MRARPARPPRIPPAMAPVCEDLEEPEEDEREALSVPDGEEPEPEVEVLVGKFWMEKTVLRPSVKVGVRWLSTS
jgi:hypothetical protein